tara:strand:+ start:412 stop:603 length:192 start_codon:yes stop_codon:yes gene_type:complete
MKRLEVAPGAVVVAASASVWVALYERPLVNGIPSGMFTENVEEAGIRYAIIGTVVPATAEVLS